MQKVYLLLRNNKQQGPFTLDELLTQTLQPLDLVWVEGRSAGWQYPSEIDSLKSFFPPKHPQVEINNASEPLKAPQINAQSSVRICPGKVYVCLPEGKAAVEKRAENPTPVSLEEKAEALFRRAQAYSTGKKEDPGELDTKYTRSLDDIKEEYSSWLYLQKQKGKKGQIKKKILMASLALPVLLVVIFYSWTRNDKTDSLASMSNLPEKAVGTKPFNSTSTVSKPSKARKKIPTKGKSPSGIVTKKTVKKPPINKTNESNNSTSASEAKAKIPAASPNLADRIRITGTHYTGTKKGVDEFQLTVQNNSDQFLRFVAVDVYYLKSDGSQVAKKTLYFNDLSPKEKLSLKAPSNRKADDIKYRLGLISSREGDLYYSKL